MYLYLGNTYLEILKVNLNVQDATALKDRSNKLKASQKTVT